MASADGVVVGVGSGIDTVLSQQISSGRQANQARDQLKRQLVIKKLGGLSNLYWAREQIEKAALIVRPN